MAILDCSMASGLPKLHCVLEYLLGPDGKLFPTHVEKFWQRGSQEQRWQIFRYFWQNAGVACQ